MSIVDRINRLILKRLRGEPQQARIVADDLVLDGQTLPLRGLKGVIAYEADIYAGTVIALALSFSNGRSVTVTQEDNCWNDLTSALDRLQLTTVPSRIWLTKIMAGSDKQIILRG